MMQMWLGILSPIWSVCLQANPVGGAISAAPWLIGPTGQFAPMKFLKSFSSKVARLLKSAGIKCQDNWGGFHQLKTAQRGMIVATADNKSWAKHPWASGQQRGCNPKAQTVATCTLQPEGISPVSRVYCCSPVGATRQEKANGHLRQWQYLAVRNWVKIAWLSDIVACFVKDAEGKKWIWQPSEKLNCDILSCFKKMEWNK